MEKLKEDFKKVLGKHKITRQDLIPIKHRAEKCDPIFISISPKAL